MKKNIVAKNIIALMLCCASASAAYGMVKTQQAQKIKKLNFEQKFFRQYMTWGDEYIRAKDYPKAFDCFKFATRTSCPVIRADAYVKLGSIYYFEGTGFTNYATAYAYLEEAAFPKLAPDTNQPKNPQARAQAWLTIAHIYLNGDKYVEKDTTAGEAYLKAAAEQSDCPRTKMRAQEMQEENKIASFCLVQ